MRALTISLLAVLALLGSQAQGSIIAQYTFDSSSFASSDTELHSTAGDITMAGLPTGAIVTGSGNPGPSLSILATDVPAALDGTKYIEFIVTAGSGYKLNLSGTAVFTFDSLGAHTGTSWSLKSSLDSYVAVIGTGGIAAGWANNDANLSSSYDGLSSIDFRLYPWGTQNNLRFDNIILNGSVVPVPEVGTLWPSLLVIGAAIASTRRFGKKKRA